MYAYAIAEISAPTSAQVCHLMYKKCNSGSKYFIE
jgi:hypothetical protein